MDNTKENDYYVLIRNEDTRNSGPTACLGIFDTLEKAAHSADVEISRMKEAAEKTGCKISTTHWVKLAQPSCGWRKFYIVRGKTCYNNVYVIYPARKEE